MKALILALLLCLLPGPSRAQVLAVTPTVTSAAANNLAAKAGPGRLYHVYAANQTATAGFLMVINATAVPSDGAVTPLLCVALPASGTATMAFVPSSAAFNTGIMAVVSSGANCFTKTTGVITAFISALIE